MSSKSGLAPSFPFFSPGSYYDRIPHLTIFGLNAQVIQPKISHPEVILTVMNRYYEEKSLLQQEAAAD